MTILLCLSIPGFLNTGQTFSWLHLLPLASGFLSALYLVTRAVIRERRTTSKNKTSAFPGWIHALLCWKPSFRFVRKRDIRAFVTPAPVVIKHVDIHSD